MTKSRKAFSIAALSLIVGTSLGYPDTPGQAQETVLKAVTFLPTNREKMKIKGIMLVDRINQLASERAPGELKIQVLGGPEVIPTGNQPIAVRTGTVDMALTCASFYEGLVPVGDIIMLSQVSIEKERESGAL